MNAGLRLATKLGAVLALVLSALFVIAPATPASADPQPEPVPFINRYDGQCLDADLGRIGVNGDAAQLWSCSGGRNQQWTIRDIDGIYGNSGIYMITNEVSGKCLESNLNYVGNGTPVQLWDCWNNPNQRWRFSWLPTTWLQPIAYFRLVNGYTGQCLDADLGNMTANGTHMQLWDCWNDPGNDQWRE